MAEKDKNNTKKWNPDKNDLKYFASALSYNLQSNKYYEYYKNGFVYHYQLQLLGSLKELGITTDDYNYNRLEHILKETTQKLEATDESNEEETTQKLSNEQFESIKSSLEEFINLQKLQKIGTELELKKSLLEELINLIKLRKLATQYLNNIGIDNLNPLIYKATRDIFIDHDIEELIETYKHKNLEVLKKYFTERAQKKAKNDPRDEALTLQKQVEEDIKPKTIFSRLLTRGGRRSTRKRKKTIRKKRKNKKRTRRFR
jgi:hypothetical protein